MMNNNFTKMNLMTGDMVELANGKLATVMLDTPCGNILRFHTEKNSFSYLDTRYTDDLKHTSHENMDIVRVYRADPERLSSSEVGDLVANPDKMKEYGAVVSERVPDFNKDSLMTGDMVRTRSGKLATVYKDTLFGDIVRYHTDNNSFSYLRRYDEDLKHESNNSFDIVEVYRVNSETHDETTVGDFIANPELMACEENLIWKANDDQINNDEDEEDIWDE